MHKTWSFEDEGLVLLVESLVYLGWTILSHKSTTIHRQWHYGKENVVYDHALSDVERANWQPLWIVDFYYFRHSNAEFLNLANWLKVVHYSDFITIHLLHQFSGRLKRIFLKNLIQSLFTKLNWSTGMWSFFQLKILIFEARKPTAGGTLRHYYSIHSTNLMSNFSSLNNLLNVKSKWVGKCSVLSTLHSILLIWKCTKIYFVEQKDILLNNIKNILPVYFIFV